MTEIVHNSQRQIQERLDGRQKDVEQDETDIGKQIGE